MKQQKTASLYDKQTSIDFYEDRYAHGYMEGSWTTGKKQRILEVIRNLDLPHTGQAIDFGCGDGILTDILRHALPAGWKVYGTDVSTMAIEKARKRFPDCTFLAAGDKALAEKRFDFLFTHHVLEHVYNLPQVLWEMQEHLKPSAAMLHILPCGNDGSFEHGVCRLRKDGINPELENRFFFEEEGHARRLTTEQLAAACAKADFALAQAYYSNQYFGAIDWITQSGPYFMRTFTDTSQAVDENAQRKLRKLRYKLWGIWALRYPAALVESRLRKRSRTIRDYVGLACGLPLYAFAKPMDLYIKRKALEEWQTRKSESTGSEMYVYFKRVLSAGHDDPALTNTSADG